MSKIKEKNKKIWGEKNRRCSSVNRNKRIQTGS